MLPSLEQALVAATGDPARVGTGALARHAQAHDASHFLLTPQAVVTARDAAEVGRLFAVSARHGVPLTLRSGGTSLSGQGVTDGILVDVRKGFRDIEVLDDGVRVRTQPGVTLRRLNAQLAPHGRKIGPDPASEGACTIGGVVANNTSGMACGIPRTPTAPSIRWWSCCRREISSTPERPTPTTGYAMTSRTSSTACCGCGTGCGQTRRRWPRSVSNSP